MVRRQIQLRNESIGEERRAETKETAHMKYDGVVVASAILRFFHGDDHDID